MCEGASSPESDAPSARDKAVAVLNAMFVTVASFKPQHSVDFYKPRATDVTVATYPKSGTTLLQYMVHEIVMHVQGTADTVITDVNEVAPWVEHALNMGVAVRDAPDPRVFKTHMPRTEYAAAGGSAEQRFVAVVREPVDAARSFMDFLYAPLSRRFDRSVRDEDAVREAALYLMSRFLLLGVPHTVAYGGEEEERAKMETPLSTWCKHVKSWIDPPQENTLVLFYEDITQNLPDTVARVSRFIGCPLTAEQRDHIARLCSRDNMANDPRFDLHSEQRVFDIGDVSKARPDHVVGFKQFRPRPELIDAMQQAIEQTFGVRSYDELRAKIKKEQQSIHGME